MFIQYPGIHAVRNLLKTNPMCNIQSLLVENRPQGDFLPAPQSV
jgi:hypothetical protein